MAAAPTQQNSRPLITMPSLTTEVLVIIFPSKGFKRSKLLPLYLNSVKLRQI